MHVLNIIFIILEVVLLFNLLIFVHELGHFIAARWRGLKVERFAIWFGKPIWKKNINGVEYALGWIPAGGYVSLPQMAPMEMIEGKSDQPHENLPPVSALDKIIVAFAGPFFSFGLAVIFAMMIFIVGRPVSESETTTTIGYVEQGGPADKAGLKVGDRIVEVDDHPVTKFEGMGSSVRWRIVRSEGSQIPIKVERDGQVISALCGVTYSKAKAWERKPLRKINIGPAFSSLVSDVISNSPAALAGIKPGDEIVAFKGGKLYSPSTIEEYIDDHGGEALPLTVKREGKTFEVSVKPEKPIGTTNFSNGILWASGGKISLARPGVFPQIQSSVDAMVSTFGALLSPKSEIKAQHLSGPWKITNIYYQLFQGEHGWRMAIWFSVILNVNLALLNLLPIPVLDGGHIVLAIIEAIRRRAISIRLLSAVQSACAVLIIGYMLYLLFYDVQDSPWRRPKDNRPQEIRFAPPEAQPQPGVK